MLVTYRLNPAFAVTNLSSSSTSGWRKNPNKQSSECNNSGRSATAKRTLCFSHFTVNKCYNCWEAPFLPAPRPILLFYTGPCQRAPEGWQRPCEFGARISVFPQTEQHSRGDNSKDCKSTPWAVWLTLLWSPSKSCRKLAWVPVVPFTPRKRRSSRARSRFCRSMHKSWIHKQQRFPTVVSCAGLKTTKNRMRLIDNLHSNSGRTTLCRWVYC